jgi:dTMP kinase
VVRPEGLFIAVEGVDAVGKRTQSSLLKSWLRQQGMSTHTLSFPAYETTIGKEIRKFLLGKVSYPPQARAMLYAANRWEMKPELERTLAKTDVTIVDRYSGSNFAYGISAGLQLEWLMCLEEGLPEPDLTLLLDAPPAKIAPRRGNKDSYERNASLQERARSAYFELASKFGWTVIDANRGIQETAKSVRAAVTGALNAKGRTV